MENAHANNTLLNSESSGLMNWKLINKIKRTKLLPKILKKCCQKGICNIRFKKYMFIIVTK